MSIVEDITGITIDYSKLPKNHSSSMHPEAVKYRRAFARMSNAIEGVILTDSDRAFMDSIKPGMPRDEFRQRVMDRLKARREEMKDNEEF